MNDAVADQFHGRGVYTSSESRYEGEFRYGKKHGHGKIVAANGDVSRAKSLQSSSPSPSWFLASALRR